jgi:hypothetical protein
VCTQAPTSCESGGALHARMAQTAPGLPCPAPPWPHQCHIWASIGPRNGRFAKVAQNRPPRAEASKSAGDGNGIDAQTLAPRPPSTSAGAHGRAVCASRPPRVRLRRGPMGSNLGDQRPRPFRHNKSGGRARRWRVQLRMHAPIASRLTLTFTFGRGLRGNLFIRGRARRPRVNVNVVEYIY